MMDTAFLTSHWPSVEAMDVVDNGDFPIPPELADRIREIELKLIERGTLLTLPEKAGRTTPGCLGSWRRLGQQIGNYPGSMSYEYIHVVGRRKTLHEIAMFAYEIEAFDVLEWLLPTLEALDDVYRSKTTIDSERLFYFWQAHPSYWWELRVPNDVGLMANFRRVDEVGTFKGNEYRDESAARHRERRRNRPSLGSDRVHE